MNANAQKLVNALRVGEFQQIVGRLKNENGHCCLGVACEIYKRENELPETWNEDEGMSFDSRCKFLPKQVREWLGFVDDAGKFSGVVEDDDGDMRSKDKSLAEENDDGMSFADIADLIESEPKGLFA